MPNKRSPPGEGRAFGYTVELLKDFFLWPVKNTIVQAPERGRTNDSFSNNIKSIYLYACLQHILSLQEKTSCIKGYILKAHGNSAVHGAAQDDRIVVFPPFQHKVYWCHKKGYWINFLFCLPFSQKPCSQRLVIPKSIWDICPSLAFLLAFFFSSFFFFPVPFTLCCSPSQPRTHTPAPKTSSFQASVSLSVLPDSPSSLGAR